MQHRRTFRPLAPTFAIACLALLALPGSAIAESQYGYDPAGGTVTAQSRLNLSLNVPKLILLRVGSANRTINTRSWTVRLRIPPAPVTPSNGNNKPVNWNGAAPVVLAQTQPSALPVYAWTNAGTGSINCAMGTWVGSNNPANGDFAVVVTGTLPHPGPNLGACASVDFPSNTRVNGTWRYILSGTPLSWGAGKHTNRITYTATGI